jgi:hypothetical protein
MTTGPDPILHGPGGPVALRAAAGRRSGAACPADGRSTNAGARQKGQKCQKVEKLPGNGHRMQMLVLVNKCQKRQKVPSLNPESTTGNTGSSNGMGSNARSGSAAVLVRRDHVAEIAEIAQIAKTPMKCVSEEVRASSAQIAQIAEIDRCSSRID